MRQQKGYSLIEIVIGLAIITIFLLCTGSLINASYTNYRLIAQRDRALDLAIKYMEEALQNDEIEESETGHVDDTYETTVEIKKVKDESSSKIYEKAFIVTVNVEYKKTPKDTRKYNLELQSLKIVD